MKPSPAASSMLWAAFDFPRHPLAREDGERVRGAFYRPPDQYLRAHRAADLAALIDAAHQASRDGAWVLGGLRYEAAVALDPALPGRDSPMPLAEFALYHGEPEPWPLLDAAAEPPAGQTVGQTAGGASLLCADWRDAQDPADEREQIERIREWIRAGDCYQVNLTTQLRSTLAPGRDLAELFLALHRAQSGGFSLFLRNAGVASVSPELFFDWRPLPEAQTSWLLAAQPMKGTTTRGHDAASDEAAQAYLRTSVKERAENLMIVDLLRNDLSRVAALGSVRVPRLFELLALPTVWQMISTVTAVSRPRLKLSELLAALFPCGSVTGAPKQRAMQIIETLEPGPRGWYCGALGLMQPGGVVTFNVPIRTVETAVSAVGDGGAGLELGVQEVALDQCVQKDESLALRVGVGSAITLDSVAEAELDEWRAKARFLLRAQAPIAALETLRLEQGVLQRLPGHLARLQRTALHFGLNLSPNEVRSALAALAQAHPQGSWRVRLTLQADGAVQSTVTALPQTPATVGLVLAARPIETRGAGAEFIQHKTTRREVYEAFARAKPPQAFDVLLWNEDGELTECTIGNIALQIDGQWLTPRLEAGLLPGVYREELLQLGRLREARLLRADLARATGLAFINSLRGWCSASLVSDSAAAPAAE
ncbi:bifunctional anthranilate synthase component I family protein/class IV aminotransferase [Paucibacter sp. AS339]|uniref:bifunctional anthranilate synthase component I family protein/class IV aminotransferase n=1 Tax=Paucibacter hankyongi TaxID=3133434 RepID=UPI0030A6056D